MSAAFRRRSLITTLLLSIIGTSAQSATVSVENGNLVFEPSPASLKKQLTSAGRDSQPQLSPDQKLVVFVRRTPGVTVPGTDTLEATELWIIGTNGTGARRLLRGRPGKTPQTILANFEKPQFSPDGKFIYFLSAAWMASAAVHRLNVTTGKESFLCAGNSLEVIYSGKYTGHLIVSQHRYFLAGGSYDWPWLVTPEGRTVGPIGNDHRALEDFRSLHIRPHTQTREP
jgi:dipeptidyl aminopeptidase/acylaminoacyl peptidase